MMIVLGYDSEIELLSNKLIVVILKGEIPEVVK